MARRTVGNGAPALLVAAAFLFAGCVGAPREALDPETAAAPAAVESTWLIADYPGMAGGESVPRWVSAYFSGGVRAVEDLEEFQGRFVFISENEGENLKALELWRAGFSLELDFARLAAARVEACLFTAAEDSGGDPAGTYGSYFEALVRAASDAGWEGAALEGDFWLLRRFFTQDLAGEEGQSRDAYDFLILVSAGKEVIHRQITDLLAAAAPRFALTEAQDRAVTRLRARFFELF